MLKPMISRIQQLFNYSFLGEFRPAFFLRMHYLFINHTETFLIKTTDWKHNFIEWLPKQVTLFIRIRIRKSLGEQKFRKLYDFS